MTENKKLTTVKELKDFLNQFNDDKRVVIQMVEGEYDRVGFIDTVSINHDRYTKKYYLPKEYHDVLMLICEEDTISSQY